MRIKEKLRVAFLITPAVAHNDNHKRIPGLFEKADWQVDTLGHDDLCWQDDRVFCGPEPANNYDLIWPIGLGPRETFLDRTELLALIAPHRLINSANSYLTLHGKSAWLRYAPPTRVARDADALTMNMAAHPGAWVLKPLAGSFGRDVRKVSSGTEVRRILQNAPRQYWMLQQFIPQIRKGETRTLIFGERIVGSYLRRPEGGFRANLAADGTALGITLDDNQQGLVEKIHTDLKQAGIRFAAIDTVGGFAMEVNIANPGGLSTLTHLYGPLIESRFMEAIKSLGHESIHA